MNTFSIVFIKCSHHIGFGRPCSNKDAIRTFRFVPEWSGGTACHQNQPCWELRLVRCHSHLIPQHQRDGHRNIIEPGKGRPIPKPSWRLLSFLSLTNPKRQRSVRRPCRELVAVHLCNNPHHQPLLPCVQDAQKCLCLRLNRDRAIAETTHRVLVSDARCT